MAQGNYGKSVTKTTADWKARQARGGADMVGMIEAIKNFNADAASTDEALMLNAQARMLAGEYTAFGEPVPEWLKEKRIDIMRETQRRIADAKASKLKALKGERQKAESAEDRRARLDREIAELEASMAPAPAPAAV